MSVKSDRNMRRPSVRDVLDQHAAEPLLGPHGLDGRDALDGVDLTRAEACQLLLQPLVGRGDATRGEAHQDQVERERRHEDQRHQPRIHEHDGERGEQLGHGGERHDPALHEHLADLADAIEAPFDVAGPPRLEVGERQREEAPGDVVERRDVDPHRDPREHAALEHRDEQRQREDSEHPDREDVQQ